MQRLMSARDNAENQNARAVQRKGNAAGDPTGDGTRTGSRNVAVRYINDRTNGTRTASSLVSRSPDKRNAITSVVNERRPERSVLHALR